MSIKSRIIDGVNSLLERVAADDTPLSGVDEAALQAELEARVKSAEEHGKPNPKENPRAMWSGASKDARGRRVKAASTRAGKIHTSQDKQRQADKRAQEEAFRRMRQEAARGQGPRRAAPSGSSSGGSQRRRRTVGGFGKNNALAQHYETLNLEYGADESAVKSAYRKLMRRYHPDRHARSPHKQKAATELTVKITQAYNELEKHFRGD